MRQATFHFDQLVKQDAVSGTKNTLNFMLHWKVHHYPWSKLHHQCSNCFTLGLEGGGACASLPPPLHTHTCFRQPWSLSMIAIEFYNINHAQWAAVITMGIECSNWKYRKINYDFDLPIKSNNLDWWVDQNMFFVFHKSVCPNSETSQ